MKKVFVLMGVVALTLALGLAANQMASANLQVFVDDDGAECPGALTSIQSAVNAVSPGTTIIICPGTYDEQVTIEKPVKLSGQNGAVVQPSNMVANATSLSSGADIAAAIVVSGTTDVNITNLTVDGSANGIAGCGPTLVGIYYRNGSGRINVSAVRDFNHGAGSGCQSGLGIFVQSGNDGVSVVDVENTSVHDYQKGGIVANGIGTTLNAVRNIVTGIGPTDGAAANGIQVGFGAAGVLDRNIVANNIWSPCVSVEVCAFVATNILVFDAEVDITGNTLGKSQTGIYLQADNGTATGNTVFDTDVWDGIVLFGNGNSVQSNIVANSDESGVFILGDNNQVNNNKISEAAIGIWNYSGTGNTLSGNLFFNTLEDVMTGSGPEAVLGASQLSIYR